MPDDLPPQQANQVRQLLNERENADAYGQTTRLAAVDKQLTELGYKSPKQAEKAADAAEEWVTDDMALRYADAFCLVGSAEHCREKLARAAEAGATNIYVRHFSSYTLPEQVLAAYGELIIPSLAA